VTTSELLLAAADRVQFQGWTRFQDAEDTAGKEVEARSPAAVAWCARAALKAENLSPYRFRKAVTAVVDYINQHDAYRRWTLITWNDCFNRTADEVADTMRRVAKELENAGGAA
jgi:hypothetical protein